MGCLVTLVMTTAVFLCVGTEATSGVRLSRLEKPRAVTAAAAAPLAAFVVPVYLVVQAGLALAIDPAQRVALGVHQSWGGACGSVGVDTVCMSDIRSRPDMPWELCEDSFESRAIGGVLHGEERGPG